MLSYLLTRLEYNALFCSCYWPKALSYDNSIPKPQSVFTFFLNYEICISQGLWKLPYKIVFQCLIPPCGKYWVFFCLWVCFISTAFQVAKIIFVFFYVNKICITYMNFLIQ